MTRFDCIAALKALGEESRLRILWLLFKERLSVNEITGRLSMITLLEVPSTLVACFST